MTTILGANFFGLSHQKNFKTKVKPVLNKSTRYRMSLEFESSDISLGEHGSLMPGSGEFVGMIVHVGVNNATVGNTHYEIVRKSLADGYSAVKIVADLEIPPGETGCFYTDPDITGNQFEQYDNMILRLWKDGGSTNNGTDDVTICLGLNIDEGPL